MQLLRFSHLLTHIDSFSLFPANVSDFTLKSTPTKQVMKFYSYYSNNTSIITYSSWLLWIKSIIDKSQ